MQEKQNMKTINVINLTLNYPINEQLPDADQRVIVGPLQVDLNKLPPLTCLQILENQLIRLGESVGFNPLNETFIFITPGDMAATAALFMTQAFWLLGQSPQIWLTTEVPGSYISMSSYLMTAISWALDQQKKQYDLNKNEEN
jgi:hypothetical protein